MAASYNFSLALSHAIGSTSKVSFYFNSGYFNIGSVTCQSSQSTNCTVIGSSNNLVEVGSLTVNSVSSLDVVLSGIVNPAQVGLFSPISINTYTSVNGTYYSVDTNTADATLAMTARPMLISDLNITTSSSVVSASSTYTFWIRNNNALPSNSFIVLYLPS